MRSNERLKLGDIRVKRWNLFLFSHIILLNFLSFRELLFRSQYERYINIFLAKWTIILLMNDDKVFLNVIIFQELRYLVIYFTRWVLKSSENISVHCKMKTNKNGIKLR